MTAACTLEVTGEIRRDVNVIKDDTRDIKDDTHNIKDDTRDIKEDTRGIKDDTCDIKDDTRNIKDIKEDTRNINDNLQINKRGPPHLSNVFIFVLIFPCHMLIAIEELQSLLHLDA